MDEVIPILRVTDATASVAWYERLGYVKEWEHRFEPSFPDSPLLEEAERRSRKSKRPRT